MPEKSINMLLPIFSTGGKMKLKVTKILENIKSDFQDILIVESKKYGRCLIIDNDMQCSEKDHKIYDNELLRPLRKEDKKILILGGGDGFVAKTALDKNPKLNITIVDLDAEVVNVCKKSLNRKGFQNKRIKLCIGDAFYFLRAIAKEGKVKFDGIICDLTYEPIGRKNKKAFNKFFEEVVSKSFRVLGPDGWISFQAGYHCNNGKYLNLRKILNKKFTKISRSKVYIPCYGEKWAFLFGEKKNKNKKSLKK